MSQNDHHSRHSHRPHWDIPPTSHALSPSTQTIKHRWAPTDHIFLTAPSLSCTHIRQIHPYTIFSAAPSPTTASSTTPRLAHSPHSCPTRFHPHAPAPRPHTPNDLPPPRRVLRLPPRPAHAAIQYHGHRRRLPIGLGAAGPFCLCLLLVLRPNPLPRPGPGVLDREPTFSRSRMRGRAVLGCRRSG